MTKKISVLSVLLAGPGLAGTADQPFELAVAYTADYWANVSGGVQRDTAYLDNLDVTIGLDAEALFGLNGVELFFYGLYNNGTPFSESAVGDAQAVSNIETGVRALRLYEAWANVRVGRHSELLFGLYDLNSEFDALESSALLMGSAHGIGTDISQTGLNGPSIFPVTGLALRLATQWNDRWSTRLAILDGVPGDPEDPRDTAIRLSEEEGALLIGEIDYTHDRSRLLLGAWGYTASFNTNPLGIGDSTEPSYGNSGAYVRGETILRAGNPTIAAFARYGQVFGDFNIFSRFVSSGITWHGLGSRSEDEFGVAFAWAETSKNVRDLAGAVGPGLDNREVAIELTYRFPVADWLTLQPNVQYVMNPGLDPTLDDALAAGVRFELQILNF
ncbi:MAG: carbohydrate porin [Proteobacteria bacterium]|nr:carbohydrate porin [Pseudomonadota bacterium]